MKFMCKMFGHDKNITWVEKPEGTLFTTICKNGCGFKIVNLHKKKTEEEIAAEKAEKEAKDIQNRLAYFLGSRAAYWKSQM